MTNCQNLFVDIAIAEEELVSGGLSLRTVRGWLNKKPVAIGIGIGIGVLALLTGGNPYAKRGKDGNITGGEWPIPIEYL